MPLADVNLGGAWYDRGSYRPTVRCSSFEYVFVQCAQRNGRGTARSKCIEGEGAIGAIAIIPKGMKLEQEIAPREGPMELLI